MDDFEKLVSECQRHGINRNIENSAWNHALILFKYMIKEAVEKNKSIRLVSGGLKSTFYDKLYDEVSVFLTQIKEKRISVEVIVLKDKEVVGKNNFISFIENGGGSIKYIPDGVKEYDGSHFILIGNDCYRIEVDHEKTKAIANFSNVKIGDMLFMIFSELDKIAVAA
jgi:hypothetical protein